MPRIAKSTLAMLALALAATLAGASFDATAGQIMFSNGARTAVQNA